MNTTMWSLRKSGARLGLLAMTAASLTLFSAGPASAGLAAPATISPTSGGSADTFTLTTPANSHCSKDTSTGHYTESTYIVPSTVDPQTLTWAGGAPSQGFQLLDTTGATLGPLNTAIGSGNIQSLPPMNWSLFSIDGSGGNANPLPAGNYNVGIACTTDTSLTDVYWNIELTFTANASDANGEVWAVTPQANVPETPLAIALPLGTILILGLGVVIAVRRRHESDSLAV